MVSTSNTSLWIEALGDVLGLIGFRRVAGAMLRDTRVEESPPPSNEAPSRHFQYIPIEC